MKYLHIMPHNSVVHNGGIISMINENSEFDKKEHEFVILNFKDTYEAFKHYDNITYEEGSLINLLNDVDEEYDFIFLHSMPLTWRNIFKVKKRVKKKIIWITWGHDLYANGIETKRGLKRFLHRFTQYIWNKNVMDFFAFGAGWKYDLIEINKKCPGIRCFNLGYGYHKDRDDSLEEKIEFVPKKEGTTRIMVGHSGFEYLNHISVLKRLEKFKNEDIIICLPMIGDTEYIRKVKEYADTVFGDKIEYLDKNLPFLEYVKFLTTVDIAIFDFKIQAALGNINLLSRYGKKLYLARDGIIKLAMDFERIETYIVDEIETVSFEEFKRPVQNPDNAKKYGKFSSKDCIFIWKNALKYLEGYKNGK